jgi:hypothetical protein
LTSAEPLSIVIIFAVVASVCPDSNRDNGCDSSLLLPLTEVFRFLVDFFDFTAVEVADTGIEALAGVDTQRDDDDDDDNDSALSSAMLVIVAATGVVESVVVEVVVISKCI